MSADANLFAPIIRYSIGQIVWNTTVHATSMRVVDIIDGIAYVCEWTDEEGMPWRKIFSASQLIVLFDSDQYVSATYE